MCELCSFSLCHSCVPASLSAFQHPCIFSLNAFRALHYLLTLSPIADYKFVLASDIERRFMMALKCECIFSLISRHFGAYVFLLYLARVCAAFLSFFLRRQSTLLTREGPQRFSAAVSPLHLAWLCTAIRVFSACNITLNCWHEAGVLFVQSLAQRGLETTKEAVPFAC